ncbi:MAG TPA: hypothetical protein VFM55_15025, partial [Micromonosporaceae bacterium]|nr:hypothetical protein [Micromonosporaceae bacterium]
RDDEAQVQRACHLVILAEITTRWPALQRRLHHHIDGQSVLHHLAIAVDDDTAWGRALCLAGYDPDLHQAALTNLRALLRTHNGAAVAHLAALVL